MIISIAPMRGTDVHGSGYFHAPRGNRLHNGIDYSVIANSVVLSPVSGVVTKLGYPYADDLSFRYVQITDLEGYKWRLFYIDPSVSVGEVVTIVSKIGVVQDLDERYPGITPHVHLEIKSPDNYFINPEDKLV